MSEDDLEYHLDDPGEENFKTNDPFCTKKRLIIFIVIPIIIIVIAVIVIFAIFWDNIFNKDNKEEDNKEENNDNIIQYINLSYFNENNEIENTFKEGGDHYNSSFGNINEGKDYKKSDLNYYNLYIPKIALNKTNDYNQIFLFLHPGAWLGLNKETMINFCRLMSNSGYISATTGYTLLKEKSADHKSIFRIIDEITATIKNIKEKLRKEGFNENKLELAIGGASAGAHLSLLYGYLMKKSSIPIKFIINIAGPVTLNMDYYLKNKVYNDTLENIEPETVNKAKNEGKLIPVNSTTINPVSLTMIMNYFLGYKYTDDELNEIIDGNEVNKTAQRYKDLLDLANQAGSPLSYVEKDSVPTINYYGGNDDEVGVFQYSLLKNKYIEVGYNKSILIFARYNDHAGALDISTESGKEAFNELFSQIYAFSNQYFHNK